MNLDDFLVTCCGLAAAAYLLRPWWHRWRHRDNPNPPPAPATGCSACRQCKGCDTPQRRP